MRPPRGLFLVVLSVGALAPAARAEPAGARANGDAQLLRRMARLDAPGAEILDYDAATNCVFCGAGSQVLVVHLGAGDDPVVIRRIDVADAAGLPAGMRAEVSHVAVDPAGRGFLAATVIPEERATLPGRVVFFSTRTVRPLGSVWVGFNPDACAFTADGGRLVVANEGEPEFRDGVLLDPPGGVSVVDLRAVHGERDLCALPQRAAVTVFAGGGVLAGVTGLRIHPLNASSPALDLEPESVVLDGNRAFVTFQENNAIGEFDLDTLAWKRIVPLPVLDVKIDASDQDGIHVDDAVAAFPMPDQIAAYTTERREATTRAGKDAAPTTVLLLAAEGDHRGVWHEDPTPLADRARVGALRAAGRIAESVPASLDRLYVCAYSGDLDGDGKIEAPRALGARLLLAVDADTLKPLGDTGSAFEEQMARAAPDWFNADGKVGRRVPDRRSDTGGPEPEGVKVGRVGERMLAFVTLERSGAVAVVDCTRPEAMEVLAVVPTAPDGDFAPEGVVFLDAAASPSGRPMLIVAFEGSGSIAVFDVEAPPALTKS